MVHMNVVSFSSIVFPFMVKAFLHLATYGFAFEWVISWSHLVLSKPHWCMLSTGVFSAPCHHQCSWPHRQGLLPTHPHTAAVWHQRIPQCPCSGTNWPLLQVNVLWCNYRLLKKRTLMMLLLGKSTIIEVILLQDLFLWLGLPSNGRVRLLCSNPYTFPSYVHPCVCVHMCVEDGWCVYRFDYFWNLHQKHLSITQIHSGQWQWLLCILLTQYCSEGIPHPTAGGGYPVECDGPQRWKHVLCKPLQKIEV